MNIDLDKGVLKKWDINIDKYEFTVNSMSFLKIVDTIKEVRGISEAAIAKQMGLNRQNLYQIRKRGTNLHRNSVINYLSRLGVDPKTILVVKKNLSIDPSEKLFLHLFKNNIGLMIKYSDEINEYVKQLADKEKEEQD